VGLVTELQKDCSVAETDKVADIIVAMKPVKIKSVSNRIEAELIKNLLCNNGIPCFYKDNAAGSYMNIFMGYSVYGDEIYVDERDYQKALELLGEISDEDDKDTVHLNSDKLDNKSKSFYSRSRLAIRIIIIIYFALGLLSFLWNDTFHIFG
jgi:hypothetical protein